MSLLDELSRQKDYENHARAHQIRCLLLAGRLDQARAQLESDVLLTGVRGDLARVDLSRYWLGQLLAMQGNNEGARDEASQLASRPAAPFSLFALRAAAEVAFEARAVSLVAAVLEKLKSIEHDFPSTRATGIRLQAHGLLTNLHGNASQAVQLLRQAHAVWSDVANTWTLAQATFALGLHQQALPLYQSVINRKGSALRLEQQTYWVRSLAMGGFCQRALHMDDEATRNFDRFLSHWGTENGLDLVKQVIAARAGR